MRTDLVLLVIDVGVAAMLGYWIALERGSPDWGFVIPHAVFVILLLVAVGVRAVKAKTGALFGAIAYGAMVIWALGLVGYISVANPRDGEHLEAYAILLGMFSGVFTFLNLVVLRSKAASRRANDTFTDRTT